MDDFPSDTFFTLSPEWGWLIIVYFFLGGIAGGAAFLAAMLDLFGAPADRPIARLGYLIAVPLAAISALLLIVDLNRPERFFHMVWKSEAGGLMFKWWSPISLGVYILILFSVFTGLALLGVLAEWGWLPRGLEALRRGPLGQVISALAGLFGLAFGGYTGVLLAATNRPLWGDTSLLGLLFLLSGISAAAALLTLLGWRRSHPGTVHWLGEMDAYSSILELIVLVVLVLSLGAVAREVLGWGWGALLAVGTGLVGIVIPLLLHYRPRLLGRLSIPSAAVMVLIGGFVLRVAVVLASEQV